MMNRKQSLEAETIPKVPQKDAANWQENTLHSCCFASLLKSHFGMGAPAPCRFAAYALKHSYNGIPLRGFASNAFTTHSSLVLETYNLCDKM